MDWKGATKDKQYWEILRTEYLRQKESGELYHGDSRLAPSLIVFFYNMFPAHYFNLGLPTFRARYISNEVEVEQAHGSKEYSIEEKKGMAAMYEYIAQYKFDGNEDFSLFEIKELHEKLFAYFPHPEAAGRYRNFQVYLPRLGRGSGNIPPIETTEPHMIAREMLALDREFEAIMKKPIVNSDDLIRYIADCVELSTKVLRIHPFHDGNGRSVRGLLTLMFKRVKLPPVYVVPKEKLRYEDALRKGDVDGDYTDIVMFYYYKLCDSLFEITAAERKKQGFTNDEYDDNGVKIYKKK